jgi:hypothetical protein
MTDPSYSLREFQRAYEQEEIKPQRCVLDPSMHVFVDHPGGEPRITYVTFEGKTVTSLVVLVNADPIEGNPCFGIGYAVPVDYRGQGRAAKAVQAAIAELRHGLARNGVRTFHVEAIVGADNVASQRVAEQAISSSSVAVVDGVSGHPARQYLLKVTR